MARRLGLPIRTWYNYESGVTVPAEVLLRFMELTSVEPLWLLHGRGSKFRTPPQPDAPSDSTHTVRSLLRTALQHLEKRPNGERDLTITSSRSASVGTNGHSTITETSPVPGENLHDQAAWMAAESEGRCLVIEGDAMSPIVSEGARVAYSAERESPEQLDGSMVVAWVHGEPLIRWFRRSGDYGLLRAENSEFAPAMVLVDLKSPEPGQKIRRVLSIGTPH